MKISGMVLVGKHEPYLEYCLKSIEDICDEIIIIYDKLEARDDILHPKARIIQQQGDKVDFARWRNQILDAAKGDWVCWLDADEVFAWKNGKPITRKHIEHMFDKIPDNIDAIQFATHHFMYNYFTLDGRQNSEHYSLRFFKNDGRRFKKKVHEYIDLKPQNTARIRDMMIWHFGHTKGIEELTGKYRERRIKDNPYTGNMSKEELESYLKTHDILRGRIPTIRYDGPLPSILKLW